MYYIYSTYNIFYSVSVYIYIKIFRRKDSLLDRIIEIKTTLAQLRRVGKLKSNFGFRIYLKVNSKKIQLYNLTLRYI